MPQPIDKKTNPVAYRLKDLRERLGYRKMEFAAFLEIAPSRWSNVETGSPVSRDVADRLKKKITGLDLDYIYDGDLDGVSEALKILLGEANQQVLNGLPLGPHHGKLQQNQPKNGVSTGYPTKRKRG